MSIDPIQAVNELRKQRLAAVVRTCDYYRGNSVCKQPAVYWIDGRVDYHVCKEHVHNRITLKPSVIKKITLPSSED